MRDNRDGDAAGLPHDGRPALLTHDQMVPADATGAGETDPGREARPQVRTILPRASGLSDRLHQWRSGLSDRLENLDLAPDLAQDIGSRRWFRGLATMLGLGALAISLWPGVAPLQAAAAMPLEDRFRDELRSQSIAPLGLGADSGRRSAMTDVVTPLAAAPERPQIALVATLARGDGFASMLRRAGVGGADAGRVAELVGQQIALGDIEPGTKVDIVLGRRPAPDERRPLDSLSFRARFDLQLSVDRSGGVLAVEREPIRVDETPLRIRGTVGPSLYRSARAAGAPASAVQKYLKVLAGHIDMDRAVSSGDTFDIIVAHRRAATGERQAGELLYAGIERDGQPRTQLMRWKPRGGGDARYFEASGVGEQRQGLLAPVPGRVSSRYGMRRHPILGYRRMHGGLDFKARHGTPIVAVTDGRVSYAGRKGGFGKFVKLNHAGNLATGYAHMSRISVRNGQQVRRGQVIGYVGSTGLSTGPHLHYEMYRGGKRVNPSSVRFVTRAQLEGSELRDFRARLAQLKTVEEGAALAELVPNAQEQAEPAREIDKVQAPRKVG